MIDQSTLLEHWSMHMNINIIYNHNVRWPNEKESLALGVHVNDRAVMMHR